MKLVATIVAAILLGALASVPGQAQSSSGGASVRKSLAQGEPRRARPRIRVRPIYPYRTFNSIYPVPYPYEYPGPNGKRDCTAYYVEEHRPSGTVVVPRMNCRWVQVGR
jgi:hypothetical protein